jgi:iron complex outermembrane recepter protein
VRSNYRFVFPPDIFDIYGWVRNVFDVNYFEPLQVAPRNVGLIASQPGDPRTVGATIKFSF